VPIATSSTSPDALEQTQSRLSPKKWRSKKPISRS
jgi:hypothetical protein